MNHNASLDRRVLIISRDFRYQGGVVNYLETLSRTFSEPEHYSYFFIGREYGKKFSLLDFFSPLIKSFRLIKKLHDENIEIVHINPSLNMRSLLRDGLYMLVVSLFSRARILVFIHGWNIRLADKIATHRIYKNIFKNVFGRAAGFLVLATQFKQGLVKIGISIDKIKVTTTMFDGKLFSNVEHRTNKLEPTLLFMSRFVREKGIYELFDAFSELKKYYTQARLLMVGDGPELSMMKAWVKENNLISSVIFTGYLREKDKIQALMDADIFVFPTYYGEGCPVALLEAMAAGLPVVTAAAGGIGDFFRDGENGVLLSQVTSQTIEQAVCLLLKNRERMSQISQTNRRQAWINYEAEVMTKGMEAIYMAVINEGEPQ